MREVVDKLSVRTTDYFVSVGVTDTSFLSYVSDLAAGTVFAGIVGEVISDELKNVKGVESYKQLDESAFDKVLAEYNERLSVRELVRIADNLGMVLVRNVPMDKKGHFFKEIVKSFGILDYWELEGDRDDTQDFLFKVRKYE